MTNRGVFVIEVRERSGEMRRMEFHKPEVTIGRVQGNDIVLPKGNVSKRHARLVAKDGRVVAVDLKSTNGSFVNGRKLVAPLVITPQDKFYVGDFVFSVELVDEFDEDTRPVDATELRLLAAIAQQDEGSRLVYADWLEEHGHVERAEFMRITATLEGTRPGTAEFSSSSDRLRTLAASIDLDWRFKVARPLIENCLAVEFECPKNWGALATTERSDVRYCGACARRVYYCSTVADARARAQLGDCVAVDVVNIRSPRDLERERPMMMGAMVPYPR